MKRLFTLILLAFTMSAGAQVTGTLQVTIDTAITHQHRYYGVSPFVEGSIDDSLAYYINLVYNLLNTKIDTNDSKDVTYSYLQNALLNYLHFGDSTIIYTDTSIKSYAFSNSALWLGDSHTFGVGSSDTSHRFSTLVCRELMYNEINFGFPGYTAQNNAAFYVSKLQSHVYVPGDILIIALGTNDATLLNDTVGYRKAMDTIINAGIAWGYPVATSILIVGGAWNDGANSAVLPQTRINYDSAAHRIANSHNCLYYSMLLPIEKFSAHGTGLQTGDVHLNNSGHAEIAMGITGVLRGPVKKNGQAFSFNRKSEFGPNTYFRNVPYSSSDDYADLGLDDSGHLVKKSPNRYILNNSDNTPRRGSINIQDRIATLDNITAGKSIYTNYWFVATAPSVPLAEPTLTVPGLLGWYNSNGHQAEVFVRDPTGSGNTTLYLNPNQLTKTYSYQNDYQATFNGFTNFNGITHISSTNFLQSGGNNGFIVYNPGSLVQGSFGYPAGGANFEIWAGGSGGFGDGLLMANFSYLMAYFYQPATFSSYIRPGSWSNSGRPSSPAEGIIGYNTDAHKMEYYNGTAWVQW